MSDTSAVDVKADKELSCRGDLCPMPIYKTRMSMNQLKAGEVLKVICTDRGALKDIPALARQAGYELLSTRESNEELVFFLKKKG